MARATEVRENLGEIKCAVAREGTTARRPQLVPARKGRKTALLHELNFSGSDLLLGFAAAVAFTGLVLWALLKLWLSGQ
jgi:hypothetical protein